MGHTCLNQLWQPRKAENTVDLAGVAIAGGVGNGGMEEIPVWDLNKKTGCHMGQTVWNNVGQFEITQEEKG